jgi:hypothetical protein
MLETLGALAHWVGYEFLFLFFSNKGHQDIED